MGPSINPNAPTNRVLNSNPTVFNGAALQVGATVAREQAIRTAFASQDAATGETIAVDSHTLTPAPVYVSGLPSWVRALAAVAAGGSAGYWVAGARPVGALVGAAAGAGLALLLGVGGPSSASVPA